jgi:DNA-binding transcriptional MerR regulator
MKTTQKKFVGGLIVVLIVTTIGVILVNAQNSQTNIDDSQIKPFEGRKHMRGSEPFLSNDTRVEPFFYNLTEEQQTQIKELIQNLKDSGANSSEIRNAVQQKLDEFGVLDERLNNTIEETEKRLEILNREKELREQGYSWSDINQMIQDEFGIQTPFEEGHGMMQRHGCKDSEPDDGFYGWVK